MRDDVRGEIIGEVDTRKYYRFYRRDGTQFDGGYFEDDRQAREYLKVRWPETSRGGTMRVYGE